jgi:hypothetical protein
MAFSSPLKLKWITAIHNIFLCLLSFQMWAVGVYTMYDRYQRLGFDELICTSDRSSAHGLIAWNMYIYYLSKYLELIDTVILVAKKKNVILLHWWHHASVIFMAWLWAHYDLMYAHFGLVWNTGIHVFMYYYYFAASLGWNVWYKVFNHNIEIHNSTSDYSVCVCHWCCIVFIRTCSPVQELRRFLGVGYFNSDHIKLFGAFCAILCVYVQKSCHFQKAAINFLTKATAENSNNQSVRMADYRCREREDKSQQL